MQATAGNIARVMGLEAARESQGAPMDEVTSEPRPTFRVKVADSPSEWTGAVAVRLAVFVDEQGVPQHLELDAHDRTAVHAVAVLDPSSAESARHVLQSGSAAVRAASQAGKYLPVSLAGGRVGASVVRAIIAPVIGTARLLGATGGTARLGRLAVLPAWRGRGVASRLLRLLEEAALARGAAQIVLHAQIAVESFYARHGYEAGEPRPVFIEDGIAHVRMSKPLSMEM